MFGGLQPLVRTGWNGVDELMGAGDNMKAPVFRLIYIYFTR
jgi:hypothetical protein